MPISIAMLENIELFNGLGDAELGELLPHIQSDFLPPQTVLFREGDAADSVKILLSGRILLYTHNHTAPIASFDTSGTFFGEMALLDDSPRSATAIAETECQILSIHRNSISRLLNGKNAAIFAVIISNIARDLADKLRMANEQLNKMK